tara:strand:+ start:750 stop:1562 length:813 start_codon:yes stop_codon:yes gene_type:complete
VNTTTQLIVEKFNEWKNSVRIHLSEDGKFYKVGDKEYPRVSRIIDIIDKPFLREGGTWDMQLALKYVEENHSSFPVDELLAEAKRQGYLERSKAMEHGNLVHDLLRQLSIDPDTAVPEEYEATVAVWEKWLSDSGIYILATEQSLYYDDESMRFAGTADLIGVDKDERLVVVDYKTSRSAISKHANYALQLSAYAMALDRIADSWGIPAKEDDIRAIVIRLPKDESEIEIREVHNIAQHQLALRNAYELRQWQSSRNKWVPNRRQNGNRG